MSERGWVGACARVPAGTFLMGSPEGQAHRRADEPQRAVTITRDFLMAKTPFTVGEWGALFAGTSVRPKPGRADNPVTVVTWFEAVWVCNELSAREGLAPSYELAGMTGAPGGGLGFEEVRCLGLDRAGYRLPTEAEWEYACRAGTQGPYYHEPLHEIAWYGANCDGLMPAGRKLPNGWGLYDMLGNTSEWVWDWYGPYEAPLEGPATRDPEGPKSGPGRVFRGGSFASLSASWLSAAGRLRAEPGVASPGIGFRWVRSF